MTTNDPTASPEQVLLHFAEGLAGLPDVLDIGFMLPSAGYPSTSRGLEFRLPDNGHAGLPGWAAHFAITSGVNVDEHVHKRTHNGGKSWQSHDVEGHWCGWTVRMWCAVDVDEPTEPTEPTEPAGGAA